MSKPMSKPLMIALLIVILVAGVVIGLISTRVFAPSPAPAEAGLKVGLILPGTIQDAGWNFIAYVSMAEVSHKNPSVKFDYVEFVSLADAERVAMDFIDAGYKVLIFHGGEYIDVVKRMATKYPDVFFISVTWAGFIENMPSNVAQINEDMFTAYYVMGYLAGLMSKNGAVGFIAPMEHRLITSFINAYYQGAKRANPNVKTYYVYSGHWDDLDKNKAAAEALIAKGVDVIAMFVDKGIFGIIMAARAAPFDVYLIGICVPHDDLDPRFIGDVLYTFADSYEYIIDKVMKGEAKDVKIRLDIVNGVGVSVHISRYVPSDIKDKVIALEKDIKEGNIKVEPIYDRIIVPIE